MPFKGSGNILYDTIQHAIVKLFYSTILVLDTYTEELKDELKQTDIAR